MMALQEALKALDAYSTSIVSKTRMGETMLNSDTPNQASQTFDNFITVLEAESREARILAIILMEEIILRPEQFTLGFMAQLAEQEHRLSAAITDANKVAHAYDARTKKKEPGESPLSKKLRELCGLN